jgi:hypothetical protein
VQLIYVEPCGEDPRFVVITREGIVIGNDRITQGKITEDSGIRKTTEKTQMFDANKERQLFEESRRIQRKPRYCIKYKTRSERIWDASGI